MNNFSKVCDSGPSSSVAGSSKASYTEDFQCEICEKVYKEKKSLNKHKRLVHTKIDKQTYTCEECFQIFETQTGINEHSSRKRVGSRAGCLLPKSVKSITRSNRSRSSKSVSEDRAGVGDVDDDLAQLAATKARGYNNFSFVTEAKSFTDLSRELLVAGDSCLNEQSLDFQLGLVEAIVAAIVAHPEFEVKSVKPDMISRIMHKRRQREALVKKVLLQEDQSNTVRRHVDNAMDCDKDCNWVVRRAMLHKQQVLLGLELYKLSSIGKKQMSKLMLKGHVMGHLRHVKRNDHLSNVRELFDMARRNYGAFTEVISLIEDCQASLVGKQFDLPPVTNRQESSAGNLGCKEGTRPGPKLQISVATLEIMENRAQRREMSRQLRSASLRRGDTYEDIAAEYRRSPAPVRQQLQDSDAPSSTSTTKVHHSHWVGGGGGAQYHLQCFW